MTSGTSLDRAPRIVVAEDDPELRLLVVDVLTDAGFEVLEADHADAALRILCSAEGVSPAVRTRAFLARTARTCDVIPRARTGLPAIAG
jgi:CheY-like chemotaxis protein